jgi:sulfite reductase (NADPH) hemoprotein beta-component
MKLAVTAAEGADRAATRMPEVGVHILRHAAGELGYRVFAGGGLGRTPILSSVIREFLPEEDLLTYLDAIVRVYNQFGRRDNKYKARIKILVKALGAERFSELVEAEWIHIKDGNGKLPKEELERIKSHFTEPDYLALEADPTIYTDALASDKAFARWVDRNVRTHKKPGYAIATFALKQKGTAPGDVTDSQLFAVADLADKYSFGEARSTHQQNLVLADIEQAKLYELWKEAKALGLATPTLGLLTDMICCPGGDFCALANAKSLPIAEALQNAFDDLDYLHDLGEIDLNISGCMNACGHHHIGNIGILGVDKKGEEFYQVSLGGASGEDASVGKILGPSFARDRMTDIIRTLLDVFVAQRIEGEAFIETFRRVGMDPFKAAVYPAKDKPAKATAK